MSELLEAAKKALPGLEFEESNDGDVSWAATNDNEAGISHDVDGFTPWFEPDNNGPSVETVEEAGAWLRAQVTARRDALNAALGEDWVPVGERLPEAYQDVLVRWGGADCLMVAYIVPDASDNPCWCERYSERDIDVTHWMPLPSCPK